MPKQLCAFIPYCSWRICWLGVVSPFFNEIVPITSPAKYHKYELPLRLASTGLTASRCLPWFPYNFAPRPLFRTIVSVKFWCRLIRKMLFSSYQDEICACWKLVRFKLMFFLMSSKTFLFEDDAQGRLRCDAVVLCFGLVVEPVGVITSVWTSICCLFACFLVFDSKTWSETLHCTLFDVKDKWSLIYVTSYIPNVWRHT